MNDFLKELGNRVRNPILYAFLISWCTINWGVIVVLFFESNHSISKTVYKTKISYIEYLLSCSTYTELFWTPFIIAILYSLLLYNAVPPLMRMVSYIFSSWFSTQTYNFVGKKKLTISAASYLDDRKRLEDSIQSFAASTKANEELGKSYQSLLKEKANWQEELKDARDLYSSLLNQRDSKFLDGLWFKRWSLDGGKTWKDECGEFNNGTYSVFLNSMETRPRAKIEYYERDKNSTSMSFSLRWFDKNMTTRSKTTIIRLQQEQSGRWTGDENDSIKVEFERTTKEGKQSYFINKKMTT